MKILKTQEEITKKFGPDVAAFAAACPMLNFVDLTPEKDRSYVGGCDTAFCSVPDCREIATGMVRDVNSPKYGDPRCEAHAVAFTGSRNQHPYNCACASCETSDLNETDL